MVPLLTKNPTREIEEISDPEEEGDVIDCIL